MSTVSPNKPDQTGATSPDASTSSSSSFSAPTTSSNRGSSSGAGTSLDTSLEDIQEGEKLQVEQGGKTLDDEEGDGSKASKSSGQGASHNTKKELSIKGLSTIAEGSKKDSDDQMTKKDHDVNGQGEDATSESAGNDDKSPETTNEKPPASSDSPLTSILEKLDSLSTKDQEVIKKNLARVAEYPRDLPLSTAWTLHFSDTSGAAKSSKATTADAYDDAVKAVFTSKTVGELCGTLKAYKRIIASKKLASPAKGARGAKPLAAIGGAAGVGPDEGGMGLTRAGQNLHFFRAGVSPTWEDPWNSKGGRLIIQPLPALFEAVFERLVLLLAGSALEVGATELLKESGKEGAKEGLIIGVVGSRRARGDRIELWLGGNQKQTPAPSEWIEAIKERLSEELDIPEVKTGTYRTHFGK